MSLQKNENSVIIKQKTMNLCLRSVQYTYHHLINLKLSLASNNANNDFVVFVVFPVHFKGQVPLKMKM